MNNDPDDLRRVLANLDFAIDYAGAAPSTPVL